MTAESLLDPRLAPVGSGFSEACGPGPELSLLHRYLLDESGDLNLTSNVLGQRLANLERASLEDLTLELFVALKLSEGALVHGRRSAARRGGAVGSGGSSSPRLSSVCSEGTLGMRRSAAMAQQSSPHYSPALTPRMPASPMGPKKSPHHRSAVGSGSGSISSTRSTSALGSSLSGSYGNAEEVEGELLTSSKLRSPRQAVSEAERQQIFDRLYSSAKEQRVRRHTYAELMKLNDEVRFGQEYPFELPVSSNRRRRSPSGYANNA